MGADAHDHHAHGTAPTGIGSTFAPGGYEDGAAERRGVQRRALRLALGANAAFLVVEVIGGLLFNSLALLADAAHMLSDVAALAIALVALHLTERPATVRHSYGLQRAEVLGAQANGLILVAVSGWIVVEAIRRLTSPAEEVAGAGVLVVASVGLLINLGSAVVLARAGGLGHSGHRHEPHDQGDDDRAHTGAEDGAHTGADEHPHHRPPTRSLNMHGAYLHMVADAAGSVAALVAGVAIVVWGADWADPVASLAVAVLVLWSAWGLLRDTAHVLLEGTPMGVDPEAVEAALLADPEVVAVHHLHVWNLASDVPSLTAHVVLRPDMTLHEAQTSGGRLKALLNERFGIGHATLELECHACEPVPGSARSG
jgi:cobalt-zinc-cadmium efflux system protein